jgi:2,4-dienoyl-CoA reductase-like NADH-dependent reductase (Old Yellow Enzyme family)/thioredoxin reductase
MSPFQLGQLRLANRIVSTPHGTGFAEAGLVSERQVAYYEERARGGVAYTVVSGWTIDPRTRTVADGGVITDPRLVEGFSRIGDAVHRHGGFLSMQLHWNGRAVAGGRRPLLAPSPIPDPIQRETPKEIDHAEINDLIEHYGIATENVRSAGWDGVEIFAAQSYGLSQFLSPHMNRRDDEYGGSLAGRMRLLLKVVDRVREASGRDMLVGVRMNGDDLVQGGFGITEACELARHLEGTGKVDYLSISGASDDTYKSWMADMGFPLGQFVPHAAEIRKVTKLPLLVSSRIKDPDQCEDILAAGHADLIGMTRALIADPHFAIKVAEGRTDDIRPCIFCNQGCIERLQRRELMSCTVNPVVGLERQLGQEIPRAAKSKKIAVVGGGPAGLEAARVAALRGHHVVLFEKRDLLGGQIELATRVSSRAEFGNFISYQRRQLQKLDVEVLLGTEATVTEIRTGGFESVVIATGSTPLRTGFSNAQPHVQEIPGHDRPNVMTACEVLEGAPVGGRILVLEDDPHSQAFTVAEYLGDQGKHVTMVSRATHVAMSAGMMNLAFTYQRLFKRGVEMVANTWISAIGESSAEAFNIYSGAPVAISPFDSVVLATGNRVEDALFRELQLLGLEIELNRIGDCLAPRRLDNAIWDGHQLGRSL